MKKTTPTELLDQSFSWFIRLKNANNEGFCICCTCGARVHWKQIDLGHFISRRETSTRWEEKNTGPQCQVCNRHKNGRSEEFAKYLDRVHGEGTAENMRIQSKRLLKLFPVELKELRAFYLQEVKRIKAEKGIK